MQQDISLWLFTPFDRIQRLIQRLHPISPMATIFMPPILPFPWLQITKFLHLNPMCLILFFFLWIGSCYYLTNRLCSTLTHCTYFWWFLFYSFLLFFLGSFHSVDWTDLLFFWSGLCHMGLLIKIYNYLWGGQ
jgi:hypothetical protein